MHKAQNQRVLYNKAHHPFIREDSYFTCKGKTLAWTLHTEDLKLLQLRLKQAIHESERSCICMSEVMYMYVRGHVYVCQRSCICMSEVSILPPFLQFLDLILRLFRQCRIFSLFLILVDNQNLLSKEYFFDKILG